MRVAVHLCFALVVLLLLSQSRSQAFEISGLHFDKTENPPEALTIIDPRSLMVIYNDDGTVRGGAYNISPLGGFYIASMHTIAGSKFFDFHKKYFRFYQFKTSDENESIDAVIFVDRIMYPDNNLQPIINEILWSLSGRPFKSGTVGFAMNGIVTRGHGSSDFTIRTNRERCFTTTLIKRRT